MIFSEVIFDQMPDIGNLQPKNAVEKVRERDIFLQIFMHFQNM